MGAYEGRQSPAEARAPIVKEAGKTSGTSTNSGPVALPQVDTSSLGTVESPRSSAPAKRPAVEVNLGSAPQVSERADTNDRADKPTEPVIEPTTDKTKADEQPSDKPTDAEKAKAKPADNAATTEESKREDKVVATIRDDGRRETHDRAEVPQEPVSRPKPEKPEKVDIYANRAADARERENGALVKAGKTGLPYVTADDGETVTVQRGNKLDVHARVVDDTGHGKVLPTPIDTGTIRDEATKTAKTDTTPTRSSPVKVIDRPTAPERGTEAEEFQLFDLHAEPQLKPGWSDADDYVEYGKNGGPLTKDRVDEMLHDDLIESLVPDKTLRHAVVKNPDKVKELGKDTEAAALRNGELFLNLKDFPKRELDTWTDGKDFPGMDMEQGPAGHILELPRGIRVVDTGLEVTDEAWQDILDRYPHLPPQLQHAILGSLVHKRMPMDDMSGDARREVRLPSGILIGSQRRGSMDLYRTGEIADFKPKTAGSVIPVAAQLYQYGLIKTQETGIPHDLAVLLYGKDVTKKK